MKSPVYDDQDQKSSISDDELRDITGISPKEEADIKNKALDGAVDDIVGREEAGGGVFNDGDAAGREREDIKDKLGDKSLFKNDDGSGGGASDSPKKSWSKRKKQMTIAGVSFVIAIFGAMLTFLGHPIQLLNLEAALGKHSATGRLVKDIRTRGFLKTTRVIRSGTATEARVTYLGSRSFGNMLDRLENQHGIDFSRHPQGQATLVTISPQANSPLVSRNAGDLARKLGIPEVAVRRVSGTGNDFRGIYEVDASRLNTSQYRGFMMNVTEFDNQTKAKANGRMLLAMRKRTVGKMVRAPSWFQPLTKAGDAAQKKWDSWTARRTAERERKARSGKKAQMAKKFQDARVSLRGRVSPSLLRVTAGALAVAGPLCTLEEVSELLPAVNYASVVLPAMDEAIDKQAVASQLKSGEDFTVDQINAVVETLSDPQNRSIWGSQPINALANGGNGTGTNITPEAQLAFTMRGSSIAQLLNALNFDELADIADFADLIADGVCSPVGYAFQFVAGGVLTLLAPQGTVARMAVQATLSGLIRNLALSITTTAVQDKIEGTVEDACGLNSEGDVDNAHSFGACMAFGARAAVNMEEASTGGVELTEDEESSLFVAAQQLEYDKFARKGLLARLFDIKESKSLAFNVLKPMDTSPTNNFANLASSIFSIPGKSVGNLASSFGGTASAQSESYDWGFPLISVPLHILEDPKYEDPYENAEEAVRLFESGYADDNKDRIAACFAAEIKRGADNRWRAEPLVNEAEGGTEVVPMLDEYVDEDCSKLDENWIRTMLFILDDSLVTSIYCYEGDRASCEEMGFSSAPSGNNRDVTVIGDKAFPIAPKSAVTNPGIFVNGDTRGDHNYSPYAYDIKAAPGTRVVAYRKGRVVRHGQDRCPGYTVSVYHEESNTVTWYAHLYSRDRVPVGTDVEPGDTIGYVGSAKEGCNTAHLHIDTMRGRARLGCSRLGCPPQVKLLFVPMGKELYELFQD